MYSDQHSGFTNQIKSGDAFESMGQKIMSLTELFYPILRQNLAQKRDENGMLLQPAKLRAMALHIAHAYVKEA